MLNFASLFSVNINILCNILQGYDDASNSRNHHLTSSGPDKHDVQSADSMVYCLIFFYQDIFFSPSALYFSKHQYLSFKFSFHDVSPCSFYNMLYNILQGYGNASSSQNNNLKCPGPDRVKMKSSDNMVYSLIFSYQGFHTLYPYKKNKINYIIFLSMQHFFCYCVLLLLIF